MWARVRLYTLYICEILFSITSLFCEHLNYSVMAMYRLFTVIFELSPSSLAYLCQSWNQFHKKILEFPQTNQKWMPQVKFIKKTNKWVHKHLQNISRPESVFSLTQISGSAAWLLVLSYGLLALNILHQGSPALQPKDNKRNDWLEIKRRETFIILILLVKFIRQVYFPSTSCYSGITFQPSDITMKLPGN